MHFFEKQSVFGTKSSVKSYAISIKSARLCKKCQQKL